MQLFMKPPFIPPVRAALAAALLSLGIPVFGQEPRRDEPIRVEVDAVNVLVTVHDSKTGKFITDLDLNHFSIEEDGIGQQITNFSRQTELPLAIALCIDTSASVKLKLDFEKQAAKDFLYTVMRPTDKALLLEFDTGVTLLQDFTNNPNEITKVIDDMRAGGGTSLYDAIYMISEQKLLEEKGRKAIVVISDGADVTSRRTFEEALQMAYQAEVSIYSISTSRMGADVDHEGDSVLKQLSEGTGGTVFFPYSEAQLTKAFKTINEELRSQYNLAYVPSNRRKDGSFRKIQVKVTRDDVRVRHRKGYFAAPQQVSKNLPH
ncbi:MAG: VWA domain-containing protein [Acidobacteria bacterium]|nr:VWA domain-containing protein [Acidobacteriota bacterium]